MSRDRCKDVTYVTFVYSIRDSKAKPNRTRLTMGGDRINHTDPVNTPTADLLTFKLLVNSIISMDNARCLSFDIKNF